MDTAIEFRVTGRVQGVGFRAFVHKSATQLGLSGWVKNESDGSVVGLAEGDYGLLQELIKQVRMGNRWSSVEGIEEHPRQFSGGYKNFEIRY